VGLLGAVFPDKIVVEEVFAASRAGWLAAVPLVTLPVLVVAGSWVGVAAARAKPRPRLTPEVWALLGWGAAFGGLLMLLDPSSIEPWTLVLPPFVLLSARFVLEPARALVPRWVIFALVAALVAHNVLAGIGIVFSRDGDYYAVLMRSVASDVRPHDLVLTTNRKLVQYVEAETHVAARNVAHDGPPSDDEIAERIAKGGRVFVSDDVVAPPSAVARRYPAMAPAVTSFWGKVRGRARAFSHTAAGTLYVLEAVPPGS
jgi:hypothetical protein